MTDILTKLISDKLVFMYSEGFSMSKNDRTFVHPSGLKFSFDYFDDSQTLDHLKVLINNAKVAHESKANLSSAQ